MAGASDPSVLHAILFYGVMGAYLPIAYAVRYAHKRISAIEKRLDVKNCPTCKGAGTVGR